MKEAQSLFSAIILYHFFYPDDVVSARHFSDFAEELVKRGWKITVLTSNRYCRYPNRQIPIKKEDWKNIKIIRVNRPAWNQANYFTRSLNALWMMMAWILKLLKMPSADVIIIGSDPQFSQLLFPILKLFKKQRYLVYWCYDLYPDALIADSMNCLVKWVAQKMKLLIGQCYKSLDLIVDLGPCMRERLNNYKIKSFRETLTPWALVEPHNIQESDPKTRYELFGNAQLALLYSGNMGKAHEFSLFLELARMVYKENPEIHFVFSCRGNRYDELRKAVTQEDYNVHFAPFADETQLEKRLISADIHLLSLNREWEGVVVPSKFFGSLAVGKPVIYAGPETSSIAKWIKEFDLGLILTEKNLEEIAKIILKIAKNKEILYDWGRNAFNCYQQYFSKKIIMDKWDTILRGLLSYKG